MALRSATFRMPAWLALTALLACNSEVPRKEQAPRGSSERPPALEVPQPAAIASSAPVVSEPSLTLAKGRVEVGETIRVKIAPPPSLGDGLQLELVDPATGERTQGVVSEHGTIAPHIVPPRAGRFEVQAMRAGQRFGSAPVEVVRPGGTVRMDLQGVMVCKLDFVEVAFASPLPRGDMRLELVPAYSPKGTRDEGRTLKAGSKSGRVQVNGPGDWEVRLYDHDGSVIGWHKLRGYYCAT